MLLTIISVVTLGSASSCSKHSYRSFSTRTAYEAVRGKDPLSSHHKGCEPIGLWTLIRHGTRHPARDEIIFMQQYLPLVQKLLVNYTGALCPDELDALLKWRMRNVLDDDLKMAAVGVAEMFNLGTRTRSRLKASVSDVTSGSAVLHVIRTDNPRTIESSEYFVKGFLGENSSLNKVDIVQNDAGADPLLLFTDICGKYIQIRKQPNNTERAETQKFDSGPFMESLLGNITHRLQLPANYLNFSIVRSMFEACRFGVALSNDATWCSVFHQSELELLEYCQDMRYFWRYGHGRSVNYLPACGLLGDVIGSIKRLISSGLKTGKRVFLRFGHSRTILPFITLLGLYKDEEDLLAQNYHQFRHKRKWRLSQINPFSSNIVFTLFSCQNGGHKMQITLNERPLAVPGCDGTLCDPRQFIRRWRAVADSCDFHEICHAEGYEAIGDLDIFHQA